MSLDFYFMIYFFLFYNFLIYGYFFLNESEYLRKFLYKLFYKLIYKVNKYLGELNCKIRF